MYIYTQLLRHEQNVTQCQYFRGVQLVWKESFPSILVTTQLRLCVYVFMQTLCNEQYSTPSQFLSGIEILWIQSFPSPVLVTLLRLKGSAFLFYLCLCICPTPPPGPCASQDQFLGKVQLASNQSFPSPVLVTFLRLKTSTFLFFVCVCIYPTPPPGTCAAQGQFLGRVLWVWNQNFPSPILIALSMLKHTVCLVNVCMYLLKPATTDRIWHKVNF